MVRVFDFGFGQPLTFDVEFIDPDPYLAEQFTNPRIWLKRRRRLFYYFD